MFRAGRFRRWGWKWWTCGNGGLSDFHEAPRKSSPIAFGLSVRILISSIAAMPDLRRRVTALRSAAAAIGWRARPLLRNQFLQAVSGCVNGTRRHKPLSNLWWCHGVPMVRIRFAPALSQERTVRRSSSAGLLAQHALMIEASEKTIARKTPIKSCGDGRARCTVQVSSIPTHWRQRLAVSVRFDRRGDWCRVSSAEAR
jgi:hypothetical protein